MSARLIRVRGQVQGVGFRPFVWRLARERGIAGHVLNDPDGVLIHAEGGDLRGFEAALASGAPPLARVDGVSAMEIAATGVRGFSIHASEGTGGRTRVAPDAATCAACLAEIRDPGDRRAGYPFANCTHCGPRFSILHRLPYDRAQTTMARFPLCDACRAEYDDPGDRRFHAQPVACAACGPRLWLEAEGREAPGDPVRAAAARLLAGDILAIKGLGGFHLACDATHAAAIATLRARKRRPGKPLALMGTPAMIASHAAPNHAERARLADPAAPIVLLPKAGAPLPEALAPGQASLGWMQPHTPLHHLLLEAVGRPLVMTSGNLSGEPQVIGNDEARARLAPFADAFLMHDRDIARRLDDSVERVLPSGPLVLRHARGRAPGTLPLPPGFDGAPPVLAYGGQMKAALCLTKGGQALLTHHLGDLDNPLTYDAYRAAEADYADLFDHAPVVHAVDLHPGYRATRHGEARAGAARLVRVQHHHAHMAAAMGDAGWGRLDGPVAGIVLDGLGLGEDGTVWGGEVLLGDYGRATRAAHLRPAALPGGDAAQRDPWRNLLMRLDQAGLGDLADEMLAGHPLDLVRQAAAAGVNAPLSSSAGRLFDAFAGALGLARDGQSYEGEAAMLLEALATRGAGDPYPFGDAGGLDPAPMFHAWAAAGDAPEDAAYRFHAGLARAFAAPARALVEQGRAAAVALSGGCFQNRLLLELTLAELRDLPVLHHRHTPPGDGGLAFGQALIAAAQVLEAF